MPTPLEKTEALLEKARTDFENIQAKKADILEKEKQAVAQLEKIENTRILQLVNMNKIDSDMLKAILMGKTNTVPEPPKPVPQKPEPFISTTNERIAENEEDE